ncbi:hypothetical protein VTN00DRAFT_553 [Thermoascus crustaceus]|uniref:uncharacterized protein n=1 Tax=Thermoascus crustaceus TaxID=5088 RepID=UPI0037422355
MPEQPRRILEKSRTVRRRYQRSNKRFQFTEAQIKQIEREEERERRAQKLREKERKRLANKKKKAEKEAKAREERRRLGLPDPNARIPASQQRLSNFFGMKKPPQEQKEEEEPGSEDSESGTSGGDTESEVEDSSGSCTRGEIQSSGWVQTDTENNAMGNDNGKESEDIMPLEDEGSVSDAETVVIDREENVNENKGPQVNANRSVADPVQSIGNSFEDETSILLQDLFPDDLDTEEEEEAERQITKLHAAETVHTTARMTTTAQPAFKPVSTPRHILDDRHENNSLPSKDNKSDMTHIHDVDSKHTVATQKPSEQPPTEIYQDPEDVLAGISTQDLADDDDFDDYDDDKENVHPNISIPPPGQQRPQQPNLSSPRRPKPYNNLQAKDEREPLSILNQPPPPPQFKLSNSSSTKLRQVSSPAAVMRKTGLSSTTATSRATGTSTVRSVSGPGALTKGTSSFSDDEFGDLDLTLEELEELEGLGA